jgi:hypothetical protein
MATKVFYNDVKMIDGQPKTVEQELEFIQWTPRYLFVKYPQGSTKAGEPWHIGRTLANYWLQIGRMRIEGDVPEWALVV